MKTSDRDQSIFSAVLWRLLPVLLAVILATVGRFWLSLSNLLFFVGGINPSGTQFICYIYNDAGYGVFPQIRDLETGELLHDLSDLEAAWGESVTWIDDETIAVLIDDRSRTEAESRCHVETLQLSPERRTIERNEIADQYVSTIVPDGNGHYCFLTGKNEGTDRYFKIMQSPPVGRTTGGKGVELVKIDLGDQEEACMSPFSKMPPGKVLVYVLPYESLIESLESKRNSSFPMRRRHRCMRQSVGHGCLEMRWCTSIPFRWTGRFGSSIKTQASRTSSRPRGRTIRWLGQLRGEEYRCCC